VAQLVAFTGHTFDQVLDGMTWPRYVALTTVWADWPPLPIAVAILARISPHHQNSTPQQGASNEDAIAELSALIGAPPPE
jgi:hypothetical protein